MAESVGDRLIDDGTERSYLYEVDRTPKRMGGLYGSVSSHDQPRDQQRDQQRDNENDDESEFDLKNAGHESRRHKRQDSGGSPNTFSLSRPKKLSVFDEYEQRGGVLEGYEDLNAESQDNDDHVLSQMVAD